MSRNLKPGQFFGNVLHKQQNSGLILSELKHEGARKLPRHSHELAYFCLLLNGNYCEQFGAKKIDYKPLSVMFHPPDTTHIDEVGPSGGRFFSVEVKSEWMERLRECLGPVTFEPSLQEGDLAWLAMRLYREHKRMDACSSLTMEGLVLEMLAVVGRTREIKERREPGWFSRTMDLLHAEFRSNLKVQDIAKEIQIHPFHLSRVFRSVQGQTIGEYVQRLRVTFACEQLRNTGIDLASIALSAGFSDQSHFTRVFKNITGLTPGTFREISNH
jgi:AraC family transcriptional regulator